MDSEEASRIRAECSEWKTKDGFCSPLLTEYDGFTTCWPLTPVGTVAQQICTANARTASNDCQLDGTWAKNSTFYTACSGTKIDAMNRLHAINERIREHCERLPEFPGYCPPRVTNVYGYVMCWVPTAPNTTANNPCPPRESFDISKFAYKECLPNGTWYIHPDSQNHTEWIDLRNCVDKDNLEYHMYINKLYVIGYTISLVALIISLLVFFAFRSLRCTRIRIHIQLFLSFVMNNTMWLIWYREVIPRSKDFGDESPMWCQTLAILKNYFLVANYMWMFCESLYLHISLVVVFVRDEVAWRWFLLIGWGVPLIAVTASSLVRIFHYRETKSCWLNESEADLIHNIPVYITLAASLVFLVNVLRVIMTIMNPNSSNPAPARVRKAARAALILIPLFGLQFLVIPIRPDDDDPYAHVYEYISVVIISLQGLCVSCLFCFANQDVHHAISGCINRRLYGSRWGNYQHTGTTADSAGVYVINGNTTNSFRML